MWTHISNLLLVILIVMQISTFSLLEMRQMWTFKKLILHLPKLQIKLLSSLLCIILTNTKGYLKLLILISILLISIILMLILINIVGKVKQTCQQACLFVLSNKKQTPCRIFIRSIHHNLSQKLSFLRCILQWVEICC